MSVSTFLGVSSFIKLEGTSDDDSVDRLSHLYTVVVLVLFAFAATGSQFIGSPMDCLMPAEFPHPYINYAQSYCWIKNTYYTPLHTAIPMDVEKREQSELTYYQWVPIILLFMALLFKTPCIFWRLMTNGYAINIDKITELIMSLDMGPDGNRKDSFRLIAQYLDRWLSNRRQYRDTAVHRLRQRVVRKVCLLGLKREGTYLTGLYLVVKLMYLANVIGQFFLLNVFMGDWYSAYGYEVMRDIVNGDEWTASARFPRLTLCDFQMRQMENVQRWTVQCVLTINIFNEKIFFFLWFWMCLVAVLTLGSFVLWLWRVGVASHRSAYIRTYLSVLGELKGEEDKKTAEQFVKEYLRNDGVFVVRMVAKNANDLLLSEAIASLWHLYKDKQKQKAEEDKQKQKAEEDKEKQKDDEDKR